jgi:hypothetical protein
MKSYTTTKQLQYDYKTTTKQLKYDYGMVYRRWKYDKWMNRLRIFDEKMH